MLNYQGYGDAARNSASMETKINWVKDVDKFESRLTTGKQLGAGETRDRGTQNQSSLSGHTHQVNSGVQAGSRLYYSHH